MTSKLLLWKSYDVFNLTTFSKYIAHKLNTESNADIKCSLYSVEIRDQWLSLSATYKVKIKIHNPFEICILKTKVKTKEEVKPT